jgi:hypothetical protein
MIRKKKLYVVALAVAITAIFFSAFFVSFVQSAKPKGTYAFKYTTGPFMLPQNTHSLNWNLLNNDNIPQTVRVTVFKCLIESEKTVELPGPLEFTLDPNESTHNANAATGGFCYEIQVETNSKLVFPSAEAWPGSIGDVIPGSEVRAAEFVRMMP